MFKCSRLFYFGSRFSGSICWVLLRWSSRCTVSKGSVPT